MSYHQIGLTGRIRVNRTQNQFTYQPVGSTAGRGVIYGQTPRASIGTVNRPYNSTGRPSTTTAYQAYYPSGVYPQAYQSAVQTSRAANRPTISRLGAPFRNPHLEDQPEQNRPPITEQPQQELKKVTGSLKISKSDKPGYAKITKEIEIPVEGEDPVSWFIDSTQGTKVKNPRFHEILIEELNYLGPYATTERSEDGQTITFEISEPIIPEKSPNFENQDLADFQALLEQRLGTGPNQAYYSAGNTRPASYGASQFVDPSRSSVIPFYGQRGVPENSQFDRALPNRWGIQDTQWPRRGIPNPNFSNQNLRNLGWIGNQRLQPGNLYPGQPVTYGISSRDEANIGIDALRDPKAAIKRQKELKKLNEKKIDRTPETKETNVNNIYNQKDGEKFKPEMPEYLVFAGGGIKGLAHLGVIQYLVEGGYDQEEQKKRRDIPLGELGVKGVIGTSAGSLIALIAALNLSYNDIYSLASSSTLRWDKLLTGIQKLKDLISTIKSSYGLAPLAEIKFIELLIEFIKDRYVDSGDGIQAFVYQILKLYCEKKGLKETGRKFTFQKLYEKTGIDLTVVVTELETGQARYLNHTNSPDLNVGLGVRTSMNIPVVFRRVKMGYFTKDNTQLSYVDGGLVDNFPIDYFDYKDPEKRGGGYERNLKTLGSYFYGYDSRIEIKPTEKLTKKQVGDDFGQKNILGQLFTLFGVALGGSSDVSLHHEIREQRQTNFYRTVKVNTKFVDVIDLYKGGDKKRSSGRD